MNPIESLSGVTAFVAAAETGSFVAAAERLRISASAVSKSVARLERGLGVSLFNRSTRSLSLTDEGQLCYQRARRIVAEMEEVRYELSQVTGAPKGRLRISLPAIGYRLLTPLLPAFIARYPDIELDMDFTDRMVDVIAEGVDIAVRSGELHDSRLRMKRLGSFQMRLAASPDYLQRHGVPATPQQLTEHYCLLYRFNASGQLQPWPFDHVTLPEQLVFSNVEAQIAAAAHGLGIIYAPDFAIRRELAEGTLVEVLPGTVAIGGQFSLVWPDNRHRLPKLRAFIDFFCEYSPLAP